MGLKSLLKPLPTLASLSLTLLPIHTISPLPTASLPLSEANSLSLSLSLTHTHTVSVPHSPPRLPHMSHTAPHAHTQPAPRRPLPGAPRRTGKEPVAAAPPPGPCPAAASDEPELACLLSAPGFCMAAAAAAAAFRLARSLRLRPVCGASRTVHAVCFPVIQLHTTGAVMRVSQEDFEKAKDQLKLLKEDPGNEVKLKLYALFKQATEGPCSSPTPGMLDFVKKAKWDAWSSLGSLSKDNARQKYVDLVSGLVSSESSSQVKDTTADSKHGYETLQVTTTDNITKIMLNRPEKKNAITTQMYREIIQALEEAAKDDSVITVITGNGDYYCSGNDLNNFTNIPPGGIEKMAKDAAILLENFVNHFIDFPKPLIAVVNGPAVGISVTLLGLFDIVYATDRATFHTPFSELGQSPEGCSSYMFPKIMGLSKANEMLLFNKKLTAREVCAQGLVTEVFPDRAFQKEVWMRLKAYANLPKNSLALSKRLIRGVEKEKLHAVNCQECELLTERWLSDECRTAIMSFFGKKSKL
ncbi:unnamed protein product [Caretta caretta]